MILQVVVIFLVRQRDISCIGQQQFLHPIFIDHIPAIVSRSGSVTYFMDSTEFRAVQCISISNGTTVLKRDLAWQI